MSFQYTPFGRPLRDITQQSNRRASVRYQCAPATSGRLMIDRTEYQRAWVIDLGACGVGLILTKLLERGQQVVVQLKSSATGKMFQLPARVIHTTTHAKDDWLIGCAFATPLTADQLDELL